MEYDRYQQHPRLYLFGLICLIASVALLFCGIYILPFLVWDYNYGVPAFLSDLISYYHDNYEYSYATSKTIIEMYFLIPGIITGLISYFISNYIENQIYKEETDEDTEVDENRTQNRNNDLKESASLGLRILVLMILVVVGILLLQTMLLS